MKHIKYIFIVILFLSCTEEIEINIPNSGAEFVVNGHIENGQPAKILLTRSLPYFDPLNDETVFESFIHDATVTITNSLGEFEELTHNPLPGFTDTWYYNYSGSSIIGEEQVTYTLEIVKDDTIVSAITTIPEIARITEDSLRFIYRPDDSTYCYLIGHLLDPDTIGNCYRAFAKTKSQNWEEDLFYISMLEQDGNYNDEYINGWNFTFPMYKGRGFWQEWGEQENEDNEVDGSSGATTGFWNVGDSVILKWSSVDRNAWDFWTSLEMNNPAGPFGAPSDVNSNINGGLGVFGGYSSEYIHLLANPE